MRHVIDRHHRVVPSAEDEVRFSFRIFVQHLPQFLRKRNHSLLPAFAVDSQRHFVERQIFGREPKHF
jgi:hypothetical protein